MFKKFEIYISQKNCYQEVERYNYVITISRGKTNYADFAKILLVNVGIASLGQPKSHIFYFNFFDKRPRATDQGRNRKIFHGGGVISAFSRSNLYFCTLKKRFSGFPKVEKKVLSFFLPFSPLQFSFFSFFTFSSFPLPFSSLSSTFFIFYLFSMPRFSRLVAKNVRVESLGGTIPPCPPPPPVTPL